MVSGASACEVLEGLGVSGSKSGMGGVGRADG